MPGCSPNLALKSLNDSPLFFAEYQPSDFQPPSHLDLADPLGPVLSTQTKNCIDGQRRKMVLLVL